MDTRNKIVDVTGARERMQSGAFRVVAGSFDVLLPQHLRTLASAAPGEMLYVAVTAAAGSQLSNRARAELVAALACVDYVIDDTPAAVSDLLAELPPKSLEDARAAHGLYWEALKAHVRRRHSV